MTKINNSVEIFIEPEHYETAWAVKSDEIMKLVREGDLVSLKRNKISLGTVRGRKRTVLLATLDFVDELEARLVNMNKTEGIMLVSADVDNEPKK